MLAPSYDLILVVASIAVSIMASFTGLILTRGISALPSVQRKFMIVMAALALGGGIWSMHFVAMLAMQLPIPISYDAVYTLGSALIAVLMSGIAFLLLHFAGRSLAVIAIAGAIMGNGIVAMHYVGMSGIRGCVPLFAPTGIALSVIAGTIMGITALYLCYAKRTTGRIFTGAVVFGLSVVMVHFMAMGWTGFRAADDAALVAPLINHGFLALLVMLSAFVICGTFLLTATTLVVKDGKAGKVPTQGAGTLSSMLATPPIGETVARLPYERDKRSYFIPVGDVVAVRAEGHYSIIYTAAEKLFCPLSISAVEARLKGAAFMRTHRSYLVNIDKVAAFERAKDNGRCLFEDVTSLQSAPVSRSFVPKVRTALGL